MRMDHLKENLVKTLKRSAGAVLAVGLLFAAGACESGISSGDTSSMSLRLTDAPAGDLDSAWVDIARITLQGDGGGVDLVTDPEGPAPGGLYELTSLAGTTADLVNDVAVPAGTYGQLRVVLDGAAVQSTDGSVFSFGGAAEALGKTADGNLQDASTSQTGIKVNLPDGGLTLDTEAKILVLDFDVSESFGHAAGQSGTWVMHPVITSSELETSGSVGGTVSTADGVSIPDCGGAARGVDAFVPLALDPASGDTLKSGDVQADGSWSIDFLAPGDYDLDYESEVAFDGESLTFEANVDPASVTVESGSQVTADYTITSASCPSGSSS